MRAMGYRAEEFSPGEIYHIYTRGVEQRIVFVDDHDRLRLLQLFTHSLARSHVQSYSTAKKLGHRPQRTAEGDGLVDLLCYCLMDNHIHLVLKGNVERGISIYLQRVLNGYAKYFNIHRQRSGPLFSGPFKAIRVDRDEQFLQVSRYIHLNPYVAHMINHPGAYQWSSLSEYLGRPTRHTICHTSLLKSIMQPHKYRRFVEDEADFARELGDIKHLLLEEPGR